MNDIIARQQNIDETIEEINKLKSVLRKLGNELSEAEGKYDKALAKTLIRLRNGGKFELDGEVVINPPASYAEKIAKGICYKEKIKKETADNLLKNARSILRATETVLSAHQSIFRHLE